MDSIIVCLKERAEFRGEEPNLTNNRTEQIELLMKNCQVNITEDLSNYDYLSKKISDSNPNIGRALQTKINSMRNKQFIHYKEMLKSIENVKDEIFVEKFIPEYKKYAEDYGIYYDNNALPEDEDYIITRCNEFHNSWLMHRLDEESKPYTKCKKWDRDCDGFDPCDCDIGSICSCGKVIVVSGLDQVSLREFNIHSDEPVYELDDI